MVDKLKAPRLKLSKVRRRDTGAFVSIGKSNLLGRGGEGAVFIDGGDCLKVYWDRDKMVPAGKIKELSALAAENVLAPLDVLLDGPNQVGYVMRHATGCLPLPEILPKGWRRANGLTPEVAMRLVLGLRAAFSRIHGLEALVVDANEMNFLLRSDLSALVHIDVDSYGTRSYAASAILPAIQDPRTRPPDLDRPKIHPAFSAASDWYSFALLAFALMVGANPFKGSFSGYGKRDLLKRMADGASALAPEAKLPPTCLPLDVIPGVWRSWFKTILHSAERPEPPTSGDAVVLAVQAIAAAGEVELIRIGPLPLPVLAEGETPLGKPLIIEHFIRRGFALVRGQTTVEIRADEVASIDGRIYVRVGGDLMELRYLETGGFKVLPRRVGSLAPHASRLFSGVAIQTLLGATFASALPRPGRCVEIRLRELEGSRVIAARFAGGAGKDGQTGVLRVAVDRAGQLEAHTWSGLTRSGFGHHNFEEVDVADVEVVELDTGVAVVSHPDGLMLFRPGSPEKTKIVKDDRLVGAPLSREAGTLLVDLPDGRYSVKLKKT